MTKEIPKKCVNCYNSRKEYCYGFNCKIKYINTDKCNRKNKG